MKASIVEALINGMPPYTTLAFDRRDDEGVCKIIVTRQRSTWSLGVCYGDLHMCDRHKEGKRWDACFLAQEGECRPPDVEGEGGPVRKVWRYDAPFAWNMDDQNFLMNDASKKWELALEETPDGRIIYHVPSQHVTDWADKV